MKIVHLVDSLDNGDAAGQLAALLPRLRARGVDSVLCSWRASCVPEFAGTPVLSLGARAPLDPFALWKLRRHVSNLAPDLVQLWQGSLITPVGLALPERLGRTVVRAPLPQRGGLAWWERRLLDQARGFAVAGECARSQCRALHLYAPLEIIAPAVATVSKPGTNVEGPRGAPLRILAFGAGSAAEGLREAVWAFDILVQLYPDARLRLRCPPQSRGEVQRFVDNVQLGAAVDWLDEADARAWQDASVCWVLGRDNCGTQLVLDAVAHACPVIASEVPGHADCVADGVTGYLVAPGDVVSLARRTRTLHLDAALCRRLTQEAQRRAAGQTADALAAQWEQLYRRWAA